MRDVLDEVVLQVSRRPHLKVHQAVGGERVEHVVEELMPVFGFDLPVPSMLTATVMSVSFVFLVTLALLSIVSSPPLLSRRQSITMRISFTDLHDDVRTAPSEEGYLLLGSGEVSYTPAKRQSWSLPWACHP